MKNQEELDRNAIRYFEQHPDKVCYDQQDETYLKVPVFSKGVKVRNHYYRVANKYSLGSGQFGKILKCYRIDPNDPDLDQTQPYAVKIIKTSHYNSEEAHALQRYYFAEAPINDGEQIYIVHEFFPGETLLQRDINLSPSLRNLDFEDSLELIHQLCLKLNSFHHLTPSTGEVTYHADIKGTNIKVNKVGKKFDVYILDFGFAGRLPAENANIVGKYICGTYLFTPPEIIERSSYSVKSDIFSLTPLILIILGARSPFSLRFFYKLDKIVRQPFDLTGLMDRFKDDLSKCHHPLKKYTEAFLQRMHCPSPDLRPDSDECLRFFTTLKNYYSVVIHTPSDREKLTAYSVELALLAANLWSISLIATSQLAASTENQYQARVTGELSFDQEQAIAILQAFDSQTLDICSLMEIARLQINLERILQDQLQDLRSCFYPDYGYQVLSHLIRYNLNKAANVLQVIRCYTPVQHYKFNLLLQFINHYTKLDVDIVQQIAKNPSVILAMKICLHYHLAYRLPLEKHRPTKKGFFETEKITINEEIRLTDKCLKNLEAATQIPDLKTFLTDREINALKNSTVFMIFKKAKEIKSLYEPLAPELTDPLPQSWLTDLDLKVEKTYPELSSK